MNEPTGKLSSAPVKSNEKDYLLGSGANSAAAQLPADNKSLQVAAMPSTTLKVISFFLNNSLVAIHFIGNGVILSSIGPNEAAAAGVINGLQAVLNGSIVGMLINSGYEIGRALGKKPKISTPATQEEEKQIDEEIGSVIKLGWLLGGSFCMITTGAFLSMGSIMPRIMHADTGRAVGDYFKMYAIGSFTEPLGAANGLVIGRFEKGTLIPIVIPFLSMALYRLPALGFGYYFAKTLGMGASGVGLGSGLAGLLSFVVTQPWFSRQVFADCKLYNFKISNFENRLKAYLSAGWKLSLQRLTEWGNMAAITILVGVWSNSSLQALQPAVQANALVAISLQGMAQASMMFISTDCAAKKKHYDNFLKNRSRNELEEFAKLRIENKKTFYKHNAAAVVLTTGITTGIYFLREPVINLFLHESSGQHYDLAETILEWGLLAFVPDAIRIISSGILRGWDDLLFPTLVSLISMTFLGVAIGGAIGYEDDESVLPLFWARIISIALSAGINCFRFYTHMQNDNQLLLDAENTLPIRVGEADVSNDLTQRLIVPSNGQGRSSSRTGPLVAVVVDGRNRTASSAGIPIAPGSGAAAAGFWQPSVNRLNPNTPSSAVVVSDRASIVSSEADVQQSQSGNRIG